MNAVAPPGSRGVDELVHEARAGLHRVSARAAAVELTEGLLAGLIPGLSVQSPVLVDIRPHAQRTLEGEIHPSYRPLVIERNVLEWRLDPRSSSRLAIAAYDLRVLVLCQEGYTSSLAAAALQQLGLWRATDVDGGFAAWTSAGLPVA